MYRAQSPYGQIQHGYPAAAPPPPGAYGAPPVAGALQPGDTTYTQVMTPDGRHVYQIFRALPASIQTASGVITGLQWSSAEQAASPPPGSRPAEPDFVNAWMQGLVQPAPAGAASATGNSKSSKTRDKETRRHSRHASEYESLQDARDKDANRRSSFHASAQQPMVPFPGGTGYPPPGAPMQGAPGAYPAFGGYPQAPGTYPAQPYPAFSGGEPNQIQQAYGNPYGATATGYPDLNRQMGELDLGRSRESDRDKKGTRSRRQSTVETARPAPETLYGGYPPFGAANAAPPGAVTGGAGIYGYPSPPSVGSRSNQSSTRPSPHVQPGEIPQYGYPVPYASSQPTHGHDAGDGHRRKRANSTAYPAGSNVYPPGHILEGQPKPPGVNDGPPPRSMSRAASPNPYNASSHLAARPKSQMGRPSPNSQHALASQLAAPEAFSRPINANLPYIGFKPLKITNMDDFFSHMPKMPQELQTHDVRNEDWFRLLEDLTLAWTGRLPINGASQRDPAPPKPSVIAAELIHTWNTAFFEQRGVEIVLYRGRRRCSGRLFGREDLPLDIYEDDDSDESSSTSSEDDDSDDPYPPPPRNLYQQPGGYVHAADDLAAARKRYYEEKMRDRQRRRERRQRRRERRKRKTYTLYAVCTREGPPPKGAQGYQFSPSMAQNMPSQPMGAVPSAYPGMLMPTAPGVAMSASSSSSRRRSQSRSSSYSGGQHY